MSGNAGHFPYMKVWLVPTICKLVARNVPFYIEWQARLLSFGLSFGLRAYD